MQMRKDLEQIFIIFSTIFALTAEPIRFFAVSLWTGKFPACFFLLGSGLG